MAYKRFFYLFFLYTIVCPRVNAQINYSGKDFWLTLGGTTLNAGTPFSYNFIHRGLLSIASKHNATVQLFFTNTGQIQTYFVSPNSVLFVPFNASMCNAITNFHHDQKDNKSVHILSDSNIVVHFISTEGKADDGTVILPSDNQRDVDLYYLLSNTKKYTVPWSDDIYFTYSIVSFYDNVQLEITPSASTYTHVANQPFYVTLNKGETFQLSNASHQGPNLSGTKIKVLSCYKNSIDIFYNSDAIFATTLGLSGCCADALLEQVIPSGWWDTSYPVISWARKPYSFCTITSTANNNNLYFDGGFITRLNEGEMFDTMISKAMVIHADKPIGIVQYEPSEGEFDSVYPHRPYIDGDPDIFWNMSISQGIRESYFIPQWYPYPAPLGGKPPESYRFLTIMSEKNNVNTIMLNGNSVSNYFQDFVNNPSWQYAHIPLDSNVLYHIVSNKKIIAYSYMEYDQGSYSFNLSDMVIDPVPDTAIPVAIIDDTLVKCPEDSIILFADSAIAYKWFNKQKSAQVTVKDLGDYWVKEMLIPQCNDKYRLHRFHVSSYDTTSIFDPIVIDTIYKCRNASVNLVARQGELYKWSTGDNGPRIIVADTGNYYVQSIMPVPFCRNRIAIKQYTVKNIDFNVRIDFGNDTSICMDSFLLLTTEMPLVHWSDGEEKHSMKVTSAGLYWANYIDSCGIEYSDSLHVNTYDCREHRICHIYFPSAFTPNKDSKNDVFRPITIGSFYSYRLLVYDRWGRQMFESNDYKDGWDGYYKGEQMPPGVYMYACFVNCENTDGNNVIKGDVTLLR